MKQNLETMFLLESLYIQRRARLESIASKETIGRNPDKILDPLTLTKIAYDNLMTDSDIQNSLALGSYTSSDALPLHVKGCRDSSVTYCICIADNSIQGGEPL